MPPRALACASGDSTANSGAAAAVSGSITLGTAPGRSTSAAKLDPGWPIANGAAAQRAVLESGATTSTDVGQRSRARNAAAYNGHE